MKSLILAAALALCAPTAQAEAFKLYSKGHWDVHYATADYGPTCVASVSGDGIYFSLDVTHDGLSAWFISDSNSFGETNLEGEVSIWIDRHVKWNTPAGARRDTIQMFGLNKKFLAQMYDGSRLYIDQDFDGKWDAWFSLQGSAAAMLALSDCADKL